MTKDTIEVDGIKYKRIDEPKIEYSGALLENCHLYICYVVAQDDEGIFEAVTRHRAAGSRVRNCFETKSHAQQYADAMNTMAELRETSVLPVDNVMQWVLDIPNDSRKCDVEFSVRMRVKLDSISPIYEAKEDAELAIKRVGGDRIIKMMEVFKGIYDE